MPEKRDAMLRALFQRAKTEVGLNREERMHFAEFLLRRDVRSWSDLDEESLSRLLDAVEGYQLITELVSQRPPGDPRRAGDTPPVPAPSSP